MSSPLLPSSFSYGDLPNGGMLAPIVIASRVPSNTIDKLFPSGYLWLSDLSQGGNGSLYYQGGNSSGSPNWTIISDGSSIVSLLGTTDQITATNVAGTVTLSIPDPFVAPGSIASTTTLTGGTGITATTGDIVATAGNITTTAGSITSATTLTATLGAITATNGNIVRGTAGNKDVYSSVATDGTAGANSAGTATLAGGTITINTTAVTASSQIRLYRQGIGATGAAALGILTLGTVTAGASFVIESVQAADATALQASDVSVIAWEIVN